MLEGLISTSGHRAGRSNRLFLDLRWRGDNGQRLPICGVATATGTSSLITEGFGAPTAERFESFQAERWQVTFCTCFIGLADLQGVLVALLE